MQPYLTGADVARRIGLTPAAVRQMESRGELKAAMRTEGGIRLFRRVDVERLAKRRAARRPHAS